MYHRSGSEGSLNEAQEVDGELGNLKPSLAVQFAGNNRDPGSPINSDSDNDEALLPFSQNLRSSRVYVSNGGTIGNEAELGEATRRLTFRPSFPPWEHDSDNGGHDSAEEDNGGDVSMQSVQGLVEKLAIDDNENEKEQVGNPCWRENVSQGRVSAKLSISLLNPYLGENSISPELLCFSL